MDNLLDDKWHWMKVKAGYCAETTGDVAAYIERGKKHAENASYIITFTNQKSGIAAKLKSASESLGRIGGVFSKVRNVCKDAEAFADIATAVAILERWNDPRGGVSNAQAAEAFDLLFGGAAKFASKLPVPFNQYSKLLEQCYISQFFSNMQSLMDVESSRTPRGRQMRAALRSIDNLD